MPKITSVESQKKNPKRFNVFLDGQFGFGANEDLVVEHRLITGKILTSEQVDKLLFEAEVGKLMERVMGLINIRARSEKEIRDYLRTLSFKRKVKQKEEISDIAIDLLINKLKQKRLISDEDFARAWVESRQKNKKKGKVAIKQELYQKGIAKEIIEEIMEKTSQDSEEVLAEQAILKRIRLWEKLENLEFKKKALEYLLRKGFEYEVAKTVVENYLKKR